MFYSKNNNLWHNLCLIASDMSFTFKFTVIHSFAAFAVNINIYIDLVLVNCLFMKATK